MEVNPTICKLIVAGAVELIDKEPVFTKRFTDHVTRIVSEDPMMGESRGGWCKIITSFDRSLDKVSIWDLGVIMSLVAYRMSINVNEDDKHRYDSDRDNYEDERVINYPETPSSTDSEKIQSSSSSQKKQRSTTSLGSRLKRAMNL